ncbi:MAG: type IV pilus modification protein PilV [Candidatus Muproteobacteria bacterium RIFCSPHIGHO2_01_FULL_65_16]|uniref:Type IV pilus modification protein PilV n=1 Tax=Candidatus Muproteobacteria bacterium RIFCSPHIGHO2_01_FULL_65_16 TaxID=1817764 RepID=A0A1F6TPZ9_9PROT|nr:MAG: type IV pilus modification protein PilV [Candidatus Muproteobacteria bacterium RIFCSPHIGHO2_01_FULL_65_16]
MRTTLYAANIIRGDAVRGFSLIEVLVALLVLSLGLLGLAGLQLTSMKYNTDAYTRTQATLFAYDILDRMRANSTGRANGDYDASTQAAADAKVSSYDSCKGSTCQCDGSTACSTSNLALYDFGKWQEGLEQAIPGAAAVRSTIERTGNQVTVTIRWQEREFQKDQKWVAEL